MNDVEVPDRQAVRALLGPANVSDQALSGMVAAQLGAPHAEVLTATAEVSAYDLEALTTAGRYWVRGTARVPSGDVRDFAFFVKVVQSWARSPIFQFVPEDVREMALASVPWTTEPAVYRSDLDDRLPDGLALPPVYGVFDLDPESASIWLGEVHVRPRIWDTARHARAAYLLGRLAASPAVAGVARSTAPDRSVRDYADGRLAHQIVPGLRDPDVWRHPLVSAAFDDTLRARMLEAVDRIGALLDELDSVPVGTAHGDACTRNLLLTDSDDSFVLIDFGFWGPGHLGHDLGQLLLGEVQMGERSASELPALEAACLPSYHRGLLDEGCDVSAEQLRRAHAILMLLFSGLSAVPFEHLGTLPTPELHRVAAERAASAGFILDLVAATDR